MKKEFFFSNKGSIWCGDLGKLEKRSVGMGVG